MARFSVAALLLLSFAAVASARQLGEPAVHAGEWATRPLSSVVETLQEWSRKRIEIGFAVEEPKQEDRFYLLVKYVIRPSLAKEFSKAWLKVREEARKQKGSLRFNLSKPLTDNLIFYSYEEWASKKDFIEYLEKKDTAARKLAEYIEESDIPLVLTQLVPAVPYEKPDTQRATITKKASLLGGQPMGVAAELLADVTDTIEGMLQPAAAKVATHAGLTRSPHQATILIKYIVKPSEAEDFIKAVAKVTDAVEKEEEDSLVYGLSKTLTDDVTYYSYAVWKSEEAIKEHLHKDYARALKHFIIEHDVYASTTVLFPIESLEE